MLIANRLCRVIDLASFQSVSNELSIQNNTARVNPEAVVVGLPDLLIGGDRPKPRFRIAQAPFR